MVPPGHSVDSDPVYILITDPAWDRDRIDEETEKNKEEEHPVLRYLLGESRFDLTAKYMYQGNLVSAAEYLKAPPEAKFKLRRLSVPQMSEIADLISTAQTVNPESPPLATTWTRCLKYGVVDIEGSIKCVTRRGVLADSTLMEIYDTLGGLPSVTSVGNAIWLLSQPLTGAEGKP